MAGRGRGPTPARPAFAVAFVKGDGAVLVGPRVAATSTAGVSGTRREGRAPGCSPRWGDGPPHTDPARAVGKRTGAAAGTSAGRAGTGDAHDTHLPLRQTAARRRVSAARPRAKARPRPAPAAARTERRNRRAGGRTKFSPWCTRVRARPPAPRPRPVAAAGVTTARRRKRRRCTRGNHHFSLNRVSKAILDTASIKKEPPRSLYGAGVSMRSSILTPHGNLDTKRVSRQGLASDGRLLRSVINQQMTISTSSIGQWDHPRRQRLRSH